jgi:hypothetical protein
MSLPSARFEPRQGRLHDTCKRFRPALNASLTLTAQTRRDVSNDPRAMRSAVSQRTPQNRILF